MTSPTRQLSWQLSRELGENLLLRRHLLVLEKVLRREVGGNAFPAERLLRLSSQPDWKGRQETRLGLRRQLRRLLEGGGASKARPPEATPEATLEAERGWVLRNAEREKGRWIEDRGLLEARLRGMLEKNQELSDELEELRGQISRKTARAWDEGRLRDLDQELKAERRKLAEDRRRLDAAQAAACRRTKEALELRARLILGQHKSQSQAAAARQAPPCEALDKYRSLLESLRRRSRDQAAAVEALSERIGQEVSALLRAREDQPLEGGHCLLRENGLLRNLIGRVFDSRRDDFRFYLSVLDRYRDASVQ